MDITQINLTQILVTFLTACVPAFIAYLTGHYQTKEKFKELELKHEHEKELLEIQQANKQNDLQNQLTYETMSKMGLEDAMKDVVQQAIASQIKNSFNQQRKN